MTRAYVVPEDVDEALELVAQHNQGAFLAGGTSRRLRAAPPETLIDLASLGLSAIETLPGQLVLGATTPLGRLVDHPAVGELAGGIVAAAAELSGPEAWREHATVGGRLLDDDVDDALGAALLVQPARAVWQQAAAHPPQEVSLEDLPVTGGGLLLRLIIERQNGWRYALESLHHTRYDQPVASVAVAIRAGAGRVRDARVAAAGVGTKRQRARHVEAALEGATWPMRSYERAQSALQADVRPVEDVRATPSFRAHAAAVLLARALRRVSTHADEAAA